MDEQGLKKTFEQLKKEMPVNEVLKQQLRGSFVKRRKSYWFKVLPAAAAVMVACIALIAVFFAPETILEKANAASLKIFNQVSFVEIGGGSNLGVAEFDGTVYVPVVEKGLFAYNEKGFTKLLDKNFGFIRVSPDGKKIVLSSGETINIYDLETKKLEELLRGDGLTEFYEQPSWAPDGNRIVYTKKVIESAGPDSHGFTEKESGIYEIDLNSRQTKKLADGSYASYVTGTNNIIFERGQKIIAKNLTDSSERVIDKGRFPAVSPDGNYVAYVKAELKRKEAAKNAVVSESVEDVWIADAGETATKRKVTSNFPHRFISEEEWLKSIRPTDVPQGLAYEGMYSYFDPSWSSDSESLFVLKNKNIEAEASLRLVRIDFTTRSLTAEDTVKRFIQALIVRDEDYAKSLMEQPPGILVVSNPHPVGYEIIASGNEDGKEYVDVKVFMAYTAQPDYSVSTSRYYLEPGENGYMINEVKGLDGNLSFFEKNGLVYMARDGKEQRLFGADDLPDQVLPKGQYRFGSLAYSEKTHTLIFTIQVLQDQGQKSSVKLLSYNLKAKEFSLLDHITQIDNNVNIGIMNLILDSDGKYAAIDLFSDDDKTFRGHVYVYNLEEGTKINLGQSFRNPKAGSVHTTYWDSENLVFNLTSHGQSMGYIYDPENGKVSKF